MEHHILSNTNPKTLNESLERWQKKLWNAQGGLVYGLIDDLPAYSVLLVRPTKKPPTKRFKPPSLDEVKEFIKEKKYKVNAEKWLTFYESKNWMVGKNKMKDWKASVRGWDIRSDDGRDPLNIPQPKPFNANKVDGSKSTSPERVRQMLIDNENKRKGNNDETTNKK